jgi:lycopene cyclase domain-containing protein
MKTDERLITRTADGGFRYEEGKWHPAWALLMLPFILAALPLLRYAGKKVDWKATAFTVIIFEALLVPAEHLALKRGHWVYNESRILGPRIFNVPVEEPFLYYLFSPLIILLIFHSFLKKFTTLSPKKGAPR